MTSIPFQSLLSATHRDKRITIGLEDIETIRRLSDAKELTCPGCSKTVTLKAGTQRIHHFAHLAGCVCTNPQTEPETVEHRNGKLLICVWMRAKLPEAEVVLEAPILETGQRADILAKGEFGRIVIEYQCANLSEKEWNRRHKLYRDNGIRDLWILGGSRMNITQKDVSDTWVLRTAELERTLFRVGAPMLFLQAETGVFEEGTLTRFRPVPDSQSLNLQGKITQRTLMTLDFPWSIFEWLSREIENLVVLNLNIHHSASSKEPEKGLSAESQVWDWLASRYHVSQISLPDFFGIEVAAKNAFACSEKVWQASLYYRFVHQRVGERWWLSEVETWARAHLPLARPQNFPQVKSALSEYQEILSSAGILSLPTGLGRVNAQILGDLTTLSSLPSREDIARLARFRKTLGRDRK